jgi:hypothetical protein
MWSNILYYIIKKPIKNHNKLPETWVFEANRLDYVYNDLKEKYEKE